MPFDLVSSPWHLPLSAFLSEVTETLGHYFIAIYPAHEAAACLQRGLCLIWLSSLRGVTCRHDGDSGEGPGQALPGQSLRGTETVCLKFHHEGRGTQMEYKHYHA